MDLFNKTKEEKEELGISIADSNVNKLIVNN